MEKTLFSQAGMIIYRFRIAIIVCWISGAALCAPFIPHIMDPFKSTGFVAEYAESTKAQAYLNKNLGYNQNNRFLNKWLGTED